MRSCGMPKGGKGGWGRLHRYERGEDESFEFTMVISPLFIMIVLIAFATVARTELMPAWSAASECARAAVTTMDSDAGREQGTNAALGLLASNYVNPDTAVVEVTPYGTWEPDTPVTCSVNYAIDVSGIPLFAQFTGGAIQVSGSVTLNTESNTSRWQ